MQLSSCEMNILYELTTSCVNSITNMAYMLDHVKDQEFKALLEKHFPYHVRDYNIKTEYLNNQQGARSDLPRFKLDGQLNDYTKTTAGQYSPIQPRTSIPDFDDREMATSYLLTLKRAGREYAWYAMDASNPEIRGFLETAFLMSNAHAYDVLQYMVRKGYYALEQADQQMVSKVGAMFKIIPENQDRVRGFVQQYHNIADGSSRDMYQHS